MERAVSQTFRPHLPIRLPNFWNTCPAPPIGKNVQGGGVSRDTTCSPKNGVLARKPAPLAEAGGVRVSSSDRLSELV